MLNQQKDPLRFPRLIYPLRFNFKKQRIALQKKPSDASHATLHRNSLKPFAKASCVQGRETESFASERGYWLGNCCFMNRILQEQPSLTSNTLYSYTEHFGHPLLFPCNSHSLLPVFPFVGLWLSPLSLSILPNLMLFYLTPLKAKPLGSFHLPHCGRGSITSSFIFSFAFSSSRFILKCLTRQSRAYRKFHLEIKAINQAF